jgi:hypothetical protein
VFSSCLFSSRLNHPILTIRPPFYPSFGLHKDAAATIHSLFQSANPSKSQLKSPFSPLSPAEQKALYPFLKFAPSPVPSLLFLAANGFDFSLQPFRSPFPFISALLPKWIPLFFPPRLSSIFHLIVSPITF